MHQIIEEQTEKVVIFCPVQNEKDKQYQFAEISRLCFSAGMEVVKIFSQDIDAFNRRTVMGSGKVEEIRQFLKANPCDCLVVDFQLTGSQLRNLSDELNIKVLDRILLIIDIFALNANQVKARLKSSLLKTNIS